MGRGDVSGLDTVVAIQPPLVGLSGFYDKGSLIANEKTLMLTLVGTASDTSGY
jgi:hypothetical protein